MTTPATPVTMRALFEAGVHFGHLTRFCHPEMLPYIYTVKNQIHIINLEKTLPLLRTAVNKVAEIAKQNGKVMFVGTKRAAHEKVMEYAQTCGMPYVNHRWLGGMLTNYKTIKQSIRRLRELETLCHSDTFTRLTKKEGLQRIRELGKLEKSLGGIKEMGGLPDALFVIDAGHERIAIQEANRLKIPVIGVVDTNHSPAGLDYPIPGNDDASAAIELYLQCFTETIVHTKEMQRTPFSGKYQEEFIELNVDGETAT